MYKVAFELAIILSLILTNGVFAMSEIAIVSARKARLEKWAKEGNEKAGVALSLANSPDSFLATIQVGISGTAILTGVFGGATVAEYLAGVLAAAPVLKPYSRGLAMAAVVLAITYASLILGELAPKRVALLNAERIACAVAVPMTWLSRVTAPVVRLLSASTDFVLALIGARASAEPPLTSEEIKLLIDQGAQQGVFAASEHDLVKSVLRLGARSVTALMTPRTELVCVDVNDPPDKVLSVLVSAQPTRVLVVDGDHDHIRGYVRVKHLLAQPAGDRGLDLPGLLEEPLYLPETKSSLEALEMFKKTGVHIAVVLDEFGGVLGVVTMTDLLKAIVGELPVAGVAGDPRAVERTDGTWLFDGRLPVDQFKEMVRLASLPDEERAHFQTLGGFVMHQVGRVPAVGDQFQAGGLMFRVISMNGNRLGKVAVARTSQGG